MQNKFKENGVEHNIDFLGFVTEEEKYLLMHKSKIFCFPSHEEGWGIVIAEALICNLNVVCYDLPVFKYIFNDFLRLVPMGNIEMFAKEIISAMSNSDATRKCGKKFIESNYSWKIIAEKELGLIMA